MPVPVSVQVCRIRVHVKARDPIGARKSRGLFDFPVPCRNLSPEVEEELVVLYCQLCKDDTPMVRRVAALNLNDFVKVVSRIGRRGL